ncbi:hypothetical protein [Massilia sp. S19_KUP03_FR1]|uniref:hypothetical protein n=1 Tax=Massilia sp. S19_KUP03_FR1 TaxID=3025503 RepID=UPI002FCD7865
MRISVLFTALALATALSACSTANIYDSLQDQARDRCSAMSDPDRSTCMNSSSTSYDDYKKQRDQATGKRD